MIDDRIFQNKKSTPSVVYSLVQSNRVSFGSFSRQHPHGFTDQVRSNISLGRLGKMYDKENPWTWQRSTGIPTPIATFKD